MVGWKNPPDVTFEGAWKDWEFEGIKFGDCWGMLPKGSCLKTEDCVWLGRLLRGAEKIPEGNFFAAVSCVADKPSPSIKLGLEAVGGNADVAAPGAKTPF